jgi:alkylhydroperoxidase family enzyme
MAGHTALARQIGYTQEEIDALEDVGGAGEADAGSGPFTPAVATALVYAGRMTDDAHTVTDALFERMRRHYKDTEILEITCVVGLANYWNRFTTALRVDLSGTDEPYDPPARG